MLFTWDPAHRLEIVANDICIDKLGVDIELMFVPWYAQIPKDIDAMYACWSYGKQYDELCRLRNITAKSGMRWQNFASQGSQRPNLLFT